jgi:hypothetical protein
MAAPTATARQAPSGQKLRDGYQVLIAFINDPNISLWEKGVKPPGMDGGEKVDQTTMHNQLCTTAAPQYLVMYTDGTARVAYDPAEWDAIHDLINSNQAISFIFPDGSVLVAYGYLRSFEPDELVRGTQPEATITIVITNLDPLTCEEECPVMIPAPGTCYEAGPNAYGP